MLTSVEFCGIFGGGSLRDSLLKNPPPKMLYANVRTEKFSRVTIDYVYVSRETYPSSGQLTTMASIYSVSLAPVVTVPSNNPFLRVEGKVSYASKIIQSTLWYTADNPNTSTAMQLAVNAGISLDTNVAGAWAALLPLASVFVSLDIMVYNNSWGKLLSTPYSHIMNTSGSINKPTAGRAQTVNVWFTLDYSQGGVVTGREKPKRSYIQWGPAFETAVNNNNSINYGDWSGSLWTSFLDGLISPWGGANGETFYPIRVGEPNDADAHAWCPILSAYLPENSGTRKSRNKN